MMIAGEASGDLHGAGVVRELRRRIPAVDVYGIGGDNMKREGMELVRHISAMSFMGFAEVLKNLPLIRAAERELESLLVTRTPDVLVLIDYPGFNLRFARKAKKHGVKVLYYISPQVWAWNRRRVKKMKSLVDRMKVVFPFEVEIYSQEGIDVEFVGHPLVESLRSLTTREDFFRANGFDPGKKLLAILPGSRRQEIERILPVMVDAASLLVQSNGVQVGIGVAPTIGPELVKRFISSSGLIRLIENGTYELMAHADAAIVTSGTATLETGWFGTPMAVVYKTSPLTYLIGRVFVNVKNIGLVNIVAGKTVVREFIQHQMRTAAVAAEVQRVLVDGAYERMMRTELSVIKDKLGLPGASARVADGIIALGEAA
jgi:lipid-A-disaccharide synthase